MIPFQSTFHDFPITHLLDAGGDAVVYRTVSSEYGTCALKVFTPYHLGARPFCGAHFSWGPYRADGGFAPTTLNFGDTDLQMALRRLQDLAIPGVETVLAMGDLQGTPWVLSPWAEAEPLRNSLAADHGLPVSELLAVASSLARSLQALHDGGFVHGAVHAGHLRFDGESLVLTDAASGYIRERSSAQLHEWAERTMTGSPDTEIPLDAPLPPVPPDPPSFRPPSVIPQNSFQCLTPESDTQTFLVTLVHLAVGARWEEALQAVRKAEEWEKPKILARHAEQECPKWMKGWIDKYVVNRIWSARLRTAVEDLTDAAKGIA